MRSLCWDRRRQDHRESFGGIEQTPARKHATGAAYENRIYDRRPGAVHMDRTAHFRGAWQSSRTGQTGIENRDSDGVVGLDPIAMVSEGKRRSRFQGPCHARVDRGETFGKVNEPTPWVILPVSSSTERVDSRWNPSACSPTRRRSQTEQKSISSLYWTLPKYGGSVNTASRLRGGRSMVVVVAQ